MDRRAALCDSLQHLIFHWGKNLTPPNATLGQWVIFCWNRSGGSHLLGAFLCPAEYPTAARQAELRSLFGLMEGESCTVLLLYETVRPIFIHILAMLISWMDQTCTEFCHCEIATVEELRGFLLQHFGCFPVYSTIDEWSSPLVMLVKMGTGFNALFFHV